MTILYILILKIQIKIENDLLLVGVCLLIYTIDLFCISECILSVCLCLFSYFYLLLTSLFQRGCEHVLKGIELWDGIYLFVSGCSADYNEQDVGKTILILVFVLSRYFLKKFKINFFLYYLRFALTIAGSRVTSILFSVLTLFLV